MAGGPGATPSTPPPAPARWTAFRSCDAGANVRAHSTARRRCLWPQRGTLKYAAANPDPSPGPKPRTQTRHRSRFLACHSRVLVPGVEQSRCFSPRTRPRCGVPRRARHHHDPLEAEHLARDSGNKQLLEAAGVTALGAPRRVPTPQRAIALLRSCCRRDAPVLLVVTKSPPLEKSPAESHAVTSTTCTRPPPRSSCAPPSLGRSTRTRCGYNQRPAVELCKLGYLLAARHGDFRQGAFIDVWLDRVRRSTSAGSAATGAPVCCTSRPAQAPPALGPASPPIRPTRPALPTTLHTLTADVETQQHLLLAGQREAH